MSDEENAPKRPKLSHREEPDGNLVAIAGPSNEQSLPLPKPQIFKLVIDCFDEIFEYLSLKDLHSFGQTCKTMQKVAGEYFKRNYSAAETHIKNGGIDTVYPDYKHSINGHTSTTAFTQFITSITQSSNELKPLRYIRRNIREFDSVHKICFSGLTLNEKKSELIKKIWPKIETISIKNCWLRGDLHNNVLTHCDNLKHLLIQQTRSRYLFRLEQNIRVPWLHRIYPKLEHLEVIPAPSVKTLELFFQNNPNVRILSTNSPSIYTRVGLMKTNIQLDLLEVKDAHGFRPIPKTFGDVLKKLYDRGFYKRLHFFTYDIDKDHSNLLASLPVLEKLCIRNWTECLSLTRLTNLKELAILDGAKSNDMEMMANSLVSLQRVYIGNATIDDILPFIRLAPKVTKIKVIPRGEAHFNGGLLKLNTLNKERGKLFEAQKVTIFVPDSIFVKTKWTTEHGNTNLKLIKIKRSDSYDWNQHYF